MKAPIDNSDYESYIAIMPGQGLAMLYKQFGARLLEQNVRSFLQFTGKINRGIRKTINEESHMFLAYNNGISATADNIELDETGHYVKRISNLQIVNGGQTTASIYHTWDKDKADISNIFVQMKISVIKKLILTVRLYRVFPNMPILKTKLIMQIFRPIIQYLLNWKNITPFILAHYSTT